MVGSPTIPLADRSAAQVRIHRCESSTPWLGICQAQDGLARLLSPTGLRCPACGGTPIPRLLGVPSGLYRTKATGILHDSLLADRAHEKVSVATSGASQSV